MQDFYVYQYVRSNPSVHGPAGSPYYIGKGHGLRAYKKNPVEIRRPKSRVHIVILHRGLSEEEAFALEMRLIEEHGRIDLGTGCLRNRTHGGEGNCGAVRTTETKAKISLAKTGRKQSEVFKRKMVEVRTGKRHSDDTKQKMSSSQKGKSKGPMLLATKKKISEAMKGRVKSEEFRAKISAANKNRNVSPETREKIAASLAGKKRSEESKAKQSATIRASHEKRIAQPGPSFERELRAASNCDCTSRS